MSAPLHILRARADEARALGDLEEAARLEDAIAEGRLDPETQGLLHKIDRELGNLHDIYENVEAMLESEEWDEHPLLDAVLDAIVVFDQRRAEIKASALEAHPERPEQLEVPFEMEAAE